jgi:hypothetical protein
MTMLALKSFAYATPFLFHSVTYACCDKGTPTLQDAITLATPSRVKLPKSLSEAHIYFQNFRVALHVLLGGTHAFTQAYDAFWRRWSTSQQYLLSVHTQQPLMFPTLPVRWVQLRVSLWFAQQ